MFRRKNKTKKNNLSIYCCRTRIWKKVLKVDILKRDWTVAAIYICLLYIYFIDILLYIVILITVAFFVSVSKLYKNVCMRSIYYNCFTFRWLDNDGLIVGVAWWRKKIVFWPIILLIGIPILMVYFNIQT